MSPATVTPGVRPATVRVLVVEDEPRLRELLVDEIAQMGYLSGGARSAEEALRILSEQAFGVALLDLHLPMMNGLDLFDRIRSQWPTVQVIVLTGNGDLAAARQAIRLDVVDFLTKPCPLSELEQALDRARRRIDPQPIFAVDLEAAGESTDISPESTTLAEVEREQILATLKRVGGNRTLAAEILGISRRTLHYRLSEYQRRGFLVD